MDWQSAVAGAVAVLSGLWMVWQVARPFVSSVPTPCAGCTFCGAREQLESREELVQIEGGS
jgi:hypothetical protein